MVDAHACMGRADILGLPLRLRREVYVPGANYDIDGSSSY